MATAVAPSISSSLSSKEHLPTTSTLLLNPIVPASKAKAKPSFQAGEVLTWKDNESRRLSLASSADAEVPFIRYDDDLTLYVGEKVTIPISIASKPLLVLRGRRRGTLQGSIVLEKTGSRLFKFWHMQPIKHALTKENIEKMQALMHKRGYKTSDDWKKELLFSVQLVKRSKMEEEVEWVDDLGDVVAIEKDGLLIVREGVEMNKRDLIVSCWACKTFVLTKPAEGAEHAE